MPSHRNLIDDPDRILEILRETRRIAVLGIKGDDRPEAPAHAVPGSLKHWGYTILPVPTQQPRPSTIHGEPTFASVQEVPAPIHVVQVFRKPDDIPAHLPDLLAARPRVVWLQKGIRHDEAAATLCDAGILVVQDRCMAVEHRRLMAG